MDEKNDGKKFQLSKRDIEGERIQHIMDEAASRSYYNPHDLESSFATIVDAAKKGKAELWFDRQGSNIYTFTLQIEGKHQLQIQITEIRK